MTMPPDSPLQRAGTAGTPHPSLRLMHSKFLLAICIIVAASVGGCVDPGSRSSQDESRSSHVTDTWLGQWDGPEGTFLRLEGGDGDYKVTIQDLDGATSYQGSAAGAQIRFNRNGITESIRATSGAETGMKWLNGKSNCLTIRVGEGYCRD